MTKFRYQFDKRPVKGGVFPCDDVREGDGLDPRYDRDEGRSVVNRKALQLCGQVRDVLNLALSGMGDEVLQNCFVEAVVPAPDSTQLLVILKTTVDPDEAQTHVVRAAGHLRMQVGAGITRKRVPNMRFEVRL